MSHLSTKLQTQESPNLPSALRVQYGTTVQMPPLWSHFQGQARFTKAHTGDPWPDAAFQNIIEVLSLRRAGVRRAEVINSEFRTYCLYFSNLV